MKPVDYLSKTADFEGFKPKVYKDTKGKRTIGYGFNLDDPYVQGYFKKAGYNLHNLKTGKTGLSEKESKNILKDLYNESYKVTSKTIKNFGELPENVQHILVDMNYNLGNTKFRGFRKMLNAVQNKDLKTAAEELKDSDYFNQTKRRALSHYEELKNSVFPPPVVKQEPIKEPSLYEKAKIGFEQVAPFIPGGELLNKVLPYAHGSKVDKYKSIPRTGLRYPKIVTIPPNQRSNYDPTSETIYLAKGEDPTVVQHEMFHHWQKLNDNLSTGPVKQSSMLDLYPAGMYNRREGDIQDASKKFLQKNPSFLNVPFNLLYDKEVEPAMYNYPEYGEGEAEEYQNYVRAGGEQIFPQYAKGGLIKRADGSYSKRGLWDNIRANKGSGKKPTKEMLRQERKIRAAEKKEDGGPVYNWIPPNYPRVGARNAQGGWLDQYEEGGDVPHDYMYNEGNVSSYLPGTSVHPMGVTNVPDSPCGPGFTIQYDETGNPVCMPVAIPNPSVPAPSAPTPVLAGATPEDYYYAARNPRIYSSQPLETYSEIRTRSPRIRRRNIQETVVAEPARTSEYMEPLPMRGINPLEVVMSGANIIEPLSRKQGRVKDKKIKTYKHRGEQGQGLGVGRFFKNLFGGCEGDDCYKFEAGGDVKKYARKGEIYNERRADELGYTPDATGHLPSVDYETSEWLKSAQHPTAWKEYLYGYTLNPAVSSGYNLGFDFGGYFGKNQLKYYPKKEDGSWVADSSIPTPTSPSSYPAYPDKTLTNYQMGTPKSNLPIRGLRDATPKIPAYAHGATVWNKRLADEQMSADYVVGPDTSGTQVKNTYPDRMSGAENPTNYKIGDYIPVGMNYKSPAAGTYDYNKDIQPYYKMRLHAPDTTRMAYGGYVPMYGKGGFLKGLGDVGLFLADTALSPVNQDIIGNKRYSDTGFGKTVKDISNVTGSISNSLAPMAANMIMPGAGTALSMAQGFSNNFVDQDKDRLASKTGQIGNQIGQGLGLASSVYSLANPQGFSNLLGGSGGSLAGAGDLVSSGSGMMAKHGGRIPGLRWHQLNPGVSAPAGIYAGSTNQRGITFADGGDVPPYITFNRAEYIKRLDAYNDSVADYLKDKQAYESVRNATQTFSSPYDEIVRLADLNERTYGYRIHRYAPKPKQKVIFNPEIAKMPMRGMPSLDVNVEADIKSRPTYRNWNTGEVMYDIPEHLKIGSNWRTPQKQQNGGWLDNL